MLCQKVKIISGWSNPGGSTLHHIALTDLLNENGIDCTFYGPHKYHLDKCQSALLSKLKIAESDIIISHFLELGKAVTCRRHILSCHETNLFPLNHRNLSQYDLIHYVSDFQRTWHSVDYPYVIIPPVIQEVKWQKPENNYAGVIGTIDSHKQTHKSIDRALHDGFEKVLLFGLVAEQDYFNEKVSDFITKGQAVLLGHESDLETMYNKVDAVYHSSVRETYGMVEAECRLAGIPFNGPGNKQRILSREEILKKWGKVIFS